MSQGDIISFSKQPTQWEVSLDFLTDRGAGDNGNLDYKIEITNPAYSFSTAELNASIGASDPTKPVGPYTLTKKFYTDATYATEITSWGLSAPVPDAGTIGGKTIYVRDSWSVLSGSNASINNIDNNYTQAVPGPLPLLGAGAAFGFSRRLRSRIKRARLA